MISCAAIALLLWTPGAVPAADSGHGTIDEAGKTAESPTADNGNAAAGHVDNSDKGTSGAAPATGPDEPSTHLKPPIPPLHLTDADRQKIRAALADQDTEVTFQLKNTKPLKEFKPTLGEKLPPHLPEHALPNALLQQLPVLKDYKYTKVNNQVLIINPMTKKIVDMFPETQG
jgi:hypothetical protein